MAKILTIEEAQTLLEEKCWVTTIHVDVDGVEAVFFSNDHGHPVVAGIDSWVPVTTYFNNGEYRVVPTADDSSGVIRNIEEIIKAFFYDTKVLFSEKELIDFILSKKPHMADVFKTI